MALSAVAFGFMAIAAKQVTQAVPAAQVALVRFAVMLLPLLFVPQVRRESLHWKRKDLLFYRGFFGGLAVLLYFIALEHLEVSTATLLNYSSPIWAVLFAALFLSERVAPMALLPASVALAGLFLVTEAYEKFNLSAWGVYELGGLLSAVFSGAAVTAIRAARKVEGSWAIYSSFSLFGLAVSLPLALQEWKWPGVMEWCWLLAVGASSIVAQLAMTFAYRWVTNLEAGLLAQMTVLLTLASEVFWFGKSLSGIRLLGAFLVVSGIVGVVGLARSPRAME
jgi:drug/metabolite transporter (DMT)-like permease